MQYSLLCLLLLLITLLTCFVQERKDTFTILAVRLSCHNNAMVFTINILLQLRYNFTALLTQQIFVKLLRH